MQRRQAGRDRPPGLYSKGLLDEVALWSYKLGGCQVLKKWLSYREQGVLGRALSPEEVQHFANTARRIAATSVASV